jgi:hypothetical protein
MKISKIVSTAVILIFVAALFSCKDDGGLGLPGWENVSKLQNYEGETVSSESNALSLLNVVLGNNSKFLEMLSEANEAAYDAAFQQKYGMIQTLYFLSKITEKSISTSVDINDSEILKTKAGVVAANLKGSSKGSSSSNQPLSLGDDSFQDDDWVSESSSIKKTFAITDGFYTFEQSTGKTYKVAGFVTVEASSDGKSTMKDVTTNKFEKSSYELERVSVTLTISGPVTTTTVTGGTVTTTTATKGGKFRLSSSREANEKSRSIEKSNEFINSDIEVYTNTNELSRTISSTDNSSLLSGISHSFIDFDSGF